MSLQGAGKDCGLASGLFLLFQFLVKLWSIPVVKVASSLKIDLALELILQLVANVILILTSLWSSELLDVLVDGFIEFLVSE
jgi:hypothetical protein